MRPEDYDGCQWPLCRKPDEVRYLAGATELNPRRDVALCDEHLSQWLAARESQASSSEDPDSE